MRENEVHAATVDIEMLTQIFLTHCGTFGVPAGETVTPRAWPAHDMFGLGALPQCKVSGIMLFFLAVQFAGGIQYIIQVTSGQFAVMMVFVVFGYIKVNGAFAFVSLAVL